MYRLLIVDDEPIIVEGLSALFQRLDRLQLEVYRAFDGYEALELVRKLRMDIVLTDIEMPGMNGIELQRQIGRLWPRCKFIFLTGYDTFDYIQSSIRGGAVDYVLKTEGDAPIIAAVEKAIGSMQLEMDADNLLRGARTRMKAALPALRREYLNALLSGSASCAGEERRDKFGELDIPLNAAAPVHLVLCRLDRWRDEWSGSPDNLTLYAVSNVAEELLAPDCLVVHLAAGQRRLVLFVQPKDGMEACAALADGRAFDGYLLGTLEEVQAACRQYLKTVCSFAVSQEPYAWEQLADKYDRLTLLFERGLGLGSETLLSDERMFAGGDRQLRTKVNRIRLLEAHLANKDTAKFFALFDEIAAAIAEPEAMQTGATLEAFYELTAVFISQLNRLELFAFASERMNVGKLLSIREHESWPEAAAYFRRLAEWLFARMSEQNERETSDVVVAVNDYVTEHLGEDLSLNRLAELVYLTPFYLSRLYKQKTGSSISDYITETRLDEAKRLLEQTHLKIHEIGERVGYDSAAYFTKFFKKLTRMTPQEYRDSAKRR
ncbi:response regulator [Paenibacillus sp. GCM10027626]|uniref:response regulator n=1 Tax=Paenibacillus sp. GCM10027626 TaxID=3273411 RepID=UPI003643C11C